MGNLRSQPVKHVTRESGIQKGTDSKTRISYGAAGMMGWRRTMEDAHIAIPDFEEAFSLFAVFDGHGGSEVSKYCAKNFPSRLTENEYFKKNEYIKSLYETFKSIDSELLTTEAKEEMVNILSKESKEESDAEEKEEQQNDEVNEWNKRNATNDHPDESSNKRLKTMQQLRMDTVGMGSGSTAVVSLIHQTTEGYKLYVANAGDSRAVLCRDGKALALSRDHSPNLESEKSRIINAGGYVTSNNRVCGNLNLSRAIGDHDFKQVKGKNIEEQIITSVPEVWQTTLQSNDDFLFLACDGIWECLSSQQAIDFVQKRMGKVELDQILDDMFNDIVASHPLDMGTDNMTALIIKLPKIQETPGNGDVKKFYAD